MKKLKLLLIAIFTFLLVDFSFAQSEIFILQNEIDIKKDINSLQVIATVPKGTELVIIDEEDGWYNVTCEYNGKEIEGWISKSQTVSEVSLTSVEDKLVLTAFQEEYLKAYTYAYIAEARAMNIYIYDANANYEKAYNMQMSNGDKQGVKYNDKLVNVCCSFVADLLKQALGAPLLGETVDGVTYKTTGIRGTGFSNPNGKGSDVFVDVSNEYLQVGDVLSYKSYNTHSGMYMGYDPDTGRHLVAQTCANTIGVSQLSGTEKLGPKITISQLNTVSKWAEASRLKASVLPKNWEYPEYINWPSKYVLGKNP